MTGRTSAAAGGRRPVVLEARLTCPACGDVGAAVMPTAACAWFHRCAACGTTLTPLPGDCCVFCSYADVPCPPVQAARGENRTRSCCG